MNTKFVYELAELMDKYKVVLCLEAHNAETASLYISDGDGYMDIAENTFGVELSGEDIRRLVK